MARRNSRAGSASGGSSSGSGRKVRRDWSKIAFYTFSILIVLSMVLSLFASLLPQS